MARTLLCGDWHGNTTHAMRMFDVAVELGCPTIVQVGDFGIWPGPDGDKYIKRINAKGTEVGVKVLFVDGNHECFPKLYKNPIDPLTGLRPVRTPGVPESWPIALYHIPRGHKWEWDGSVAMGVGGAVSVDRMHRTPGKSWWPEETLTPADIERVELAGEADILFTHDAPTCIPMAGLKNDPDSYYHRQLMNDVGDSVNPRLWVHGHFHQFLDYEFGRPDRAPTKVIGLNMDGAPDSFAVLDTRARTIRFPTRQGLTYGF